MNIVWSFCDMASPVLLAKTVISGVGLISTAPHGLLILAQLAFRAPIVLNSFDCLCFRLPLLWTLKHPCWWRLIKLIFPSSRWFSSSRWLLFRTIASVVAFLVTLMAFHLRHISVSCSRVSSYVFVLVARSVVVVVVVFTSSFWL